MISEAIRRLRALLERNTLIVLSLAASAAVHIIVIRRAVVSDSWLTLVSGRLIRTSGIPHRETLTTLAQGREWVDQQWLGHLGLYGLWAAGGWALVLLSVVALYAAAFVIAAAAARQLGASERSVALLAPVCFATGVANTVLRAQIPAYVLFALVLALLLADERRPSQQVYLTFPLLVLWANIHGSVVLGAGLVALRGAAFAVASLRARAPAGGWLPRAATFLIVPWLCTLASPYGFALPGYYHRILFNSSFGRAVSEWGPSTLRAEPLFFALLLCGLWLVSRGRSATSPFAQLALFLTGVAGLVAIRNIVWFALVAAAVLPPALDALWPAAAARRRRRINVGLMTVAALVLVVTATATATRKRAWFERSYPARAAAAVGAATASDPRRRVFADERYADWLLFEEPYLAGRVAYDARLELLSSRQFSSIVSFKTERGTDWQQVARGYELLVLDPSGEAGAISFFKRRAGTKVLFRSSDVVVLRQVTTRER